jgi:hypothetical protein
MKTSQTEAILEHLKSGKTITPIEALNLYGSFRLAARISDLRQQGHNIITEGKDQWAVYRLVDGVSKAVPASSFCIQNDLISVPPTVYNEFLQ